MNKVCRKIGKSYNVLGNTQEAFGYFAGGNKYQPFNTDSIDLEKKIIIQRKFLFKNGEISENEFSKNPSKKIFKNTRNNEEDFFVKPG